jgi:hypothetical protein
MELALDRRSADGSCDERRSVVRTTVAIGIAGALGALARYRVEGTVAPRAAASPWGTFIVNVSGSFLLGVVFTLLGERLTGAPWVRAAGLPLLDEMVGEGMVTLERVEVIAYRGSHTPS